MEEIKKEGVEVTEQKPVETTEQVQGTQTQTETLTFEKVEKMIQSATDKVRTDYSQKLKAKELELEEEKVKHMTEAEKKQHEINQKQKELDDQLFELRQEKLKNNTIEHLKENNLPIDLYNVIKGNDIDEIKGNVEKYKTIIDAFVQSEVEKRLGDKGTNPVKPTLQTGAITKDQIKKMSYSQVMALEKQNPSLKPLIDEAMREKQRF